MHVGVALTSKVYFAGYMLAAIDPVPRLILQSRADVAWTREKVSRTPYPVKILRSAACQLRIARGSCCKAIRELISPMRG